MIGIKQKFEKIHNTFIDIFFQNIKKGFLINNKDDFKDFISIEKFCEIIMKIIKHDLRGTYNVSIGQKIYLDEILEWLNKYNNKVFVLKDKIEQNDCFFLNNRKLMSKIKIKNSKLELKKYCLKVSRKFFLTSKN